MTLLRCIDNEVPGRAEWDATVQGGGNAVRQVAAAGFPESGTRGLEFALVNHNQAYVLAALPAPTDTLAVGLRFRLASPPTWSPGNSLMISAVLTGASDYAAIVYLYCHAAGPRWQVFVRDDAGFDGGTLGSQALQVGRWYELRYHVRFGASEAAMRVWLDGALAIDKHNAGSAAAIAAGQVVFGSRYSTAGIVATWHEDDMRIGTEPADAAPRVPAEQGIERTVGGAQVQRTPLVGGDFLRRTYGQDGW